jgi:phage baseplate assembly protein V
MSALVDQLRRFIAPLQTRVLLMIGRALVLTVNDNKRVQELQLAALKGEVIGRAERLQTFGHSSNPPLGSEVAFVCVGGSRAHPIVIAGDSRELRPQGLEAGGSKLYDSAAQHVVCLPSGGRVEVKANGEVTIIAATQVKVQAPLLIVEGDIEATGNVSDSVGSMADMRTIYNSHTHPENGAPGPTAPPLQPM